VLENVMIGRLGRIHPLRSWLYGFNDEEAHAALRTLARTGMESFAHRVTGSLSGGEMQRVAVARTLFQQPLMLLADEPIASLDPKNAHEIMRILKSISAQIPICGVFHQPDIVSQYCTRVIGIRQGAVAYNGPPDLSQDQLEAIYGDELRELGREQPPPQVESEGREGVEGAGRLIEG
jgi:phosphonate transport system ATP-binding protein